MNSIFKEKKAMHSIVAITLLLGVTVIGFILIKNSYIYYTSNLIENSREENLNSQGLKVEGITKDEIYLLNNLKYNQTILRLEIKNINCNITNNEILIPGINKINISDCNTQEDGIVDILVALENNVLRGSFSIIDN
ncbi:MAG: hypothetical protein ACOC16_00640 [Nanoarchaeota archaeon]